MKKLFLVCSLCITIFMVFSSPLPVQAEEAVVYGIFFYSPTCPHCHEVISNHWPQIHAEFGDQLQVLFIDVSGQKGFEIMRAVTDALLIESRSVPMLIIGSEVLIGSVDIPEKAPDVIRAGLAAGGIDFPAIPGIYELFQSAVEQSRKQANADNPGDTPTVPLSLGERLAADRIANALAVAVLIMMVLSLAVVLPTSLRSRPQSESAVRIRQWTVPFLALIGFGLAVSLALGWQNDWIVLLIAISEGLIFLVITLQGVRVRASTQLPGWLVPLAALAGIVVAGYLAAVEVTLSEAVCGAVGNCNTVQQSSYARILGIPIGVIGVAGYACMLLIWYAGKIRHDLRVERILLLLVVVGVIFSAYLTFLEPFVIGATCVWCLTSSVVMLILLWLVLPTPVQGIVDSTLAQKNVRRFA